MDNDDETIFNSPKSIIGIVFIGAVSVYVIYYIYVYIIKGSQSNSNQNNIFNLYNNQNNNNHILNNSNKNKQIIKPKMSINMSLFMKDSKKLILEDINILYNLFDKLSDYYNLYLLIYMELF